MSTNEVIFEVLEATGLNWTVNKEPLKTANADIPVPDYFACIRSDNNESLGIVGNRYAFLQNHEMAHTIYEAGGEVFDKDLNLTHPWNNAETLGSFGNMGGGSLKGGAKVFLQLALPDAYVGKSDIKRYITITNHHDGSGSLGFGTTNQVVCCANTFAMAQKQISKIRHTASINERVDEAAENLRRMLGFEEKQMEVFEAASNRAFDKNHIEDIVKAVFNTPLSADKSKVSTRTQNQMVTLAGDINKSIDEQGETLWALFNGVTRFTNHSRFSKDKDHSLMFGSDAKINERAFNTLLGWMDIKPKDLVTV